MRSCRPRRRITSGPAMPRLVCAGEWRQPSSGDTWRRRVTFSDLERAIWAATTIPFDSGGNSAMRSPTRASTRARSWRLACKPGCLSLSSFPVLMMKIPPREIDPARFTRASHLQRRFYRAGSLRDPPSALRRWLLCSGEVGTVGVVRVVADQAPHDDGEQVGTSRSCQNSPVQPCQNRTSKPCQNRPDIRLRLRDSSGAGILGGLT